MKSGRWAHWKAQFTTVSSLLAPTCTRARTRRGAMLALLTSRSAITTRWRRRGGSVVRAWWQGGGGAEAGQWRRRGSAEAALRQR